MQRLLSLLLCAATFTGYAANWYCTNSFDLQFQLTNQAVRPGDTVWLMGGTYKSYMTNNQSLFGMDTNCNQNTPFEPLWLFWLNGPQYTNRTNFVTFRSATNQWAAIDGTWRDGYQCATTNHLPAYGAVKFQDLEFYDSDKGHHYTNLCSYPNGPWSFSNFKTTYTYGFVNCVIHDIDGGVASGSNNFVRGCVIWNVGVNSLEHVTYPSPSTFIGNIVGYTVDDVIEHISVPNFLMESNIIFGGGQTINPSGGMDCRLDTFGCKFDHNYTYDYFPSNVLNGAQGLLLGPNAVGTVDMEDNILVNGQPVTFYSPNAYTNVIFLGNTVVVNYIPAPPNPCYDWFNLQAYLTNSCSFNIDSNAYYNTGFVPTLFSAGINGKYRLSLPQWQQTNAFDLDSYAPTTIGSLSSNVVAVIPNLDEPKRCNIAVYNFMNSNNVPVNLGGVLNAGDVYKLYNAQDYGRGAIQTGTYNGTNIVVPMTNLTTAPILFGTNWGLFQAPPLSPRFCAFVVIGADLTPPYQLRVISQF